jgi:hypothetical protein
MSIDELQKVKPYPQKALAALRFLREIMDDYTFNAIYKAADEIAKSRERRLATPGNEPTFP